LIGQAHTGTGKTAAFGLPAMSRIARRKGVGLLVITPTRELATQVSDELHRLGRHARIHTATVYGGQPYHRQIEHIERGAQVVVATPGRLLDLLKGGSLRRFAPSIVVLDEADEMLDMGFLDDIREIFAHLPEPRQTLLFSATMPAPIRQLARQILHDPATVTVTSSEATNKDISQHYYVIEESERDDATIRLIDSLEAEKSIIFCRTKSEVDRVNALLQAQGYASLALHGDMDQRQREKAIAAFRRNAEILVATDVAARGLDVSDVTHVFNYHIAFNPESYVHRIGRTGRAGRKGMAVTLVTPMELREIRRIQQQTGKAMTQSLIPTGTEMRASAAERLAEAIRHQPLHEGAAPLLQLLAEEMDPAHLAHKLLSMLMDRQSVAGPETIGLRGERLKRTMERLHTRPAKGGRGKPRHHGGQHRTGPGRIRHGNTGRPGGKGRKKPY
ncbi:MAG TPA: DEAD/DEAH box helicase, partial [Mariprofundaceae bacterium]|nr:DEAD/DEAH box helicase [Mariprofundaceae bacterium]